MSRAKQNVETLNGQAQGGNGTCEFRVGGMDCASCATDVRRALEKLTGVQDVRVDVIGGKVQVEYAPGKLARGDLAATIRRIGYRVEEGGESKSASFTVDGMDCADEVRQIEAKLGQLPGVAKLNFDLIKRRLVVDGAITAPEIQRAIKQLGMKARPEGQHLRAAGFWERRGRLMATLISGVFLASGGLAILLKADTTLTTPLLAISTIAGGWFIAPRGIRAARSGFLDMNFLMTIAAIGAAAIGEWGEAASAVFLFAVAQMLEVYSMDRARSAIKKLMDLSPPEAIVVREGQQVTVSVGDVRIGEVIAVRPGQRVALDGTVLSGRSSLNQAPITGESIPVDKEPGSEIFAGSINLQGALEIRVTKLVEDTTLARIIHAVEEAQAARAPSQSFVDRFARIYTPAVVAFAFAVAVVPPLIGIGSWNEWFYRALTMLVIACPCALVISTPVSIVSGLAGAARGGILIKGGAHLENAGAITTVALDKTGTLTFGRPAVTDVIPLDGHRASDILRWAAAIEQHSEHPLAAAIIQQSRKQGTDIPRSTDFEALIGRGAKARIDGKIFYLGNERLCRELGALTDETERHLKKSEQSGKTAVVLIREKQPLGVIAISDEVRPNAAQAMAELRKLGVSRLVMLTGDNRRTASAVAEKAAITEYHAGLLPEDKVRIVRELEQQGEKVAFVGDGVNDAPALAAATVGIAMGAAGTDVALETADIALMGDDLQRMSLAMRLSRKTLLIIKQNIWFSIAIKFVFLVLALAGWATLWMAVAADMGASLVVIANALRALRVKENRPVELKRFRLAEVA